MNLTCGPPAESGRPRIGRDGIWQALLARRQRAVEGAGGLTLLEGGGGIGKSTFLALFAQDSIAAGFRVVNAKASWVDDPPPFRLIGDVLKALAASTQSPRAGARPPASVSAFLSSHPRFVRGEGSIRSDGLARGYDG